MYFVNDSHKENYWKMMEMFGLNPGESVQYESSIYVAAYPDIFRCFNDGRPQSTSYSPLFELMRWDEVENCNIPGHAALTGTTSKMVDFGFSCYNGHRVSMDIVMDGLSNEVFEVMIQALKVRAKQ